MVHGFLEGLELLGRGAEAYLYKGLYAGVEAVFKWRPPKKYRHPVLDSRIRRERTLREARNMAEARLAGVNAPAVLLVDEEAGLLVMEYVRGVLLRDEVEGLPDDKLAARSRMLGRLVARLHSAGIIHGDLTTSNIVDTGRRLVLIDFGLSARSERLEDRGVDVNVFLRAVESTHPTRSQLMYEEFLEGYGEEAGEKAAEEIRGKVEEIRMRGRYVEERRMRLI